MIVVAFKVEILIVGLAAKRRPIGGTLRCSGSMRSRSPKALAVSPFIWGRGHMIHKISVLALAVALSGPAYADPPPQQIAFPPNVGQNPAPVTPSNPFPVEEQAGQGVDGSGFIVGNDSGGTTVVLFGGVTPPHGFQVQALDGAGCVLSVNDTGDNNSAFAIALPASTNFNGGLPNIYTTPPGYRPIGPVTVRVGAGCDSGNPFHFAARMW